MQPVPFRAGDGVSVAQADPPNRGLSRGRTWRNCRKPTAVGAEQSAGVGRAADVQHGERQPRAERVLGANAFAVCIGALAPNLGLAGDIGPLPYHTPTPHVVASRTERHDLGPGQYPSLRSAGLATRLVSKYTPASRVGDRRSNFKSRHWRNPHLIYFPAVD